MALGFLKKKKVPDELPELASDEVKGKDAKPVEEPKKEEAVAEKKEEVKTEDKVAEKPKEETKTEDKPKEEVKIDNSLDKDKDAIVSHLSDEEKIAEDKKDDSVDSGDAGAATAEVEQTQPQTTAQTPGYESYFGKVKKQIDSGMVDVEKLKEWNDKQFSGQDGVKGMREYWEKQKDKSVVDALKENFKQSIEQASVELQNLEAEWQNVYFDLVEKETQIKEKEEELKNTIAEFVKVFNKKKTTLDDIEKDNEQKKVKKKKKKATR